MANIKAMTNRATRKYLRINATDEWKRNCLKKANYKCDITRKTGSLDVHHKNITFDSIMADAHKKLNIKYHKHTTDYKPEELAALVQEIKEMHKDVEGVVINHSYHMEFHDRYGMNATADDYKEFKKLKRIRLYKSRNGSYKARVA